MKKQLFAILLLTLFVTNANGQKVDSASKVAPITDSTLLFSIRDLNEFDVLMKTKFTIDRQKEYNELIGWLQTRVNQRIQEFQRQSAIKPKKP